MSTITDRNDASSVDDLTLAGMFADASQDLANTARVYARGVDLDKLAHDLTGTRLPVGDAIGLLVDAGLVVNDIDAETLAAIDRMGLYNVRANTRMRWQHTANGERCLGCDRPLRGDQTRVCPSCDWDGPAGIQGPALARIPRPAVLGEA